MKPVQEQLQTIALLLHADVAGALRYLNGLTAYRFSGLYVFGTGEARSWYLVDRDQPEPDTALTAIPLTATYCAFVRDRRGLFRVVDALTDERLTDHPSRTAVRSYCGVPLLDSFGTAVGSLCHFDTEPQAAATSGENAALLELVAPLFAERLAHRGG